MNQVKILYYVNSRGDSPAKTWFDKLPDKAQTAGQKALTLLGEFGHYLDRPHVGYLGDKI